jgi:hypothetical protein
LPASDRRIEGGEEVDALVLRSESTELIGTHISISSARDAQSAVKIAAKLAVLPKLQKS